MTFNITTARQPNNDSAATGKRAALITNYQTPPL
jgi:hypothetical protein